MTDSWLTYSCRVREADVTIVESCFEAAGALSVSCVAAESRRLVVDLVDGALPLWSVCDVAGLFALDFNFNDIDKALSACGVIPLQARITTLRDRNWQESWRDQFHPQCFGEALWICPSWAEPPEDAKLVVRIDPGMAFGTGNHETTALCLEWLSMSDTVVGAKVLDYGCGSGIIGLAAARLGAAEVTAVDIDRAALQVCRENAVLNGLPDIVIGEPEIINGRRYDVIVANILLEPLLQLSEHLTLHLVRGGHIVLSGILVEQAATLLAAYSGKYKMQTPWQRGDWALLAGVLNSP